MISHQYVDIENLNEFREQILKVISEHYDLTKHKFLVSDEMKPLVLNIPIVKETLEKLGVYDYVTAVTCNITAPNESVPLHIDSGGFLYSLNVPLSGYENSCVNVYSPEGEPEMQLVLGEDGSFNAYYEYDKNKCDLLETIVTDRPVFLYVKNLHNVVNDGDHLRLMLLFRLHPSFDLTSYNNKEKK